ncbi:MAG TPA: hypothetical protein VE033_03190 [Acetobacteraceae bacterium]|nr:hypothetical protein [Acetobacteraceae bacterium]
MRLVSLPFSPSEPEAWSLGCTPWPVQPVTVTIHLGRVDVLSAPGWMAELPVAAPTPDVAWMAVPAGEDEATVERWAEPPHPLPQPAGSAPLPMPWSTQAEPSPQMAQALPSAPQSLPHPAPTSKPERPPIVPADPPGELPPVVAPATPPTLEPAPATPAQARIEVAGTWWGGFRVEIEVTANRPGALPDLLLGSRWQIAEAQGAERLAEMPAPFGTMHVLRLVGDLADGPDVGESVTLSVLGTTGLAGQLSAQAILDGIWIA